MLKITIEIKENKNTDTCKIDLISPKDLSKATQNEKNVGAFIMGEIDKMLKEKTK